LKFAAGNTAITRRTKPVGPAAKNYCPGKSFAPETGGEKISAPAARPETLVIIARAVHFF
jgi:hypothetical protein